MTNPPCKPQPPISQFSAFSLLHPNVNYNNHGGRKWTVKKRVVTTVLTNKEIRHWNERDVAFIKETEYNNL